MLIKLKTLRINRRGDLSLIDRDGTQIDYTRATRDAASLSPDPRTAEREVETEFRKTLPDDVKSELHVHKNADGSFAYALGSPPPVWPEEEKWRF